MSHIELQSIFDHFKEHFPPAEDYIEGLTLKLTTAQISEIFNDFCPDIEIGNLYGFMIEQGYRYLPIESSEEIKFYWLIGRSQTGQGF